MLEILLIIWLGRKLAAMAKLRGRSPGWAALGVCFWFGGELTGFVIGGVVGLEMGAYPSALLLAILGAWVSYLVVGALPPGDRPVFL